MSYYICKERGDIRGIIFEVWIGRLFGELNFEKKNIPGTKFATGELLAGRILLKGTLDESKDFQGAKGDFQYANEDL